MIAQRRPSPLAVVCLLLISGLSAYTYLPGYAQPSALFWDENFHVASAQRYLNGVFFLEPHPPLGKLLIAAGEALIQANSADDQFVGYEKASTIPQDFSFRGYRLIPTLCGALIAPLIFLVIFSATGNVTCAALAGSMAVFDNALIVHSRSAMLEAPQIVSLLLSYLGYVQSISGNSRRRMWYFTLGIAFSAAMAIKINSAPHVILIAALLLRDRKPVWWSVWCILPAVGFYLLVWQLHFFLGTRVVSSLDGQGYFGVHKEFARLIDSGDSRYPQNLFTGLSESLAFSARYQKGVPKLDHCKAGENGSNPLLWPLGGRTINYRWESSPSTDQSRKDIRETPSSLPKVKGDLDEPFPAGNASYETSRSLTRYLYLVPNPVSWAAGLCSVVLLSFLLLLGLFRRRWQSLSALIGIVLVNYFAAWLAPLLMPRVFYLYHYLVPLVCSWLMLGLAVSVLPRSIQRILSVMLLPTAIVSYAFFSPLTYYEPLSDEELQSRAWISLWDVRCPNCTSSFSSRCPDSSNTAARSDKNWQLSLGDIKANYIEQSVGTPLQSNATFEIMTKSKIQFPINSRIKKLRGNVGLTEDNVATDVEVKVLADGRELWSAILNKDTHDSSEFQLTTEGTSVLTFVARNSISTSKSSALQWTFGYVEPSAPIPARNQEK